MPNALDEVYTLAFELADEGMPRTDVLRQVLHLEEHDPEVWMVEWSARLSPELWQQILASAVNADLDARFEIQRHRIEDYPKDYDDLSEEEKQADIDALYAERIHAWHTVKYQDIDKVARTLSQLSRDWYASGERDVAAGYRKVRIGEFKKEVYGVLVDEEAWTPEDLDPEAQEKFKQLADEVWPIGRPVKSPVV